MPHPTGSTRSASKRFSNQNQVQTFRDERDIRGGSNWDKKIDEELRACTRMVLLLSTHSMPHRKEVHREWFFFDQDEQTDLPAPARSRATGTAASTPINHIDATRDREAAFDQVAAPSSARRRTMRSPEPRTLADQVDRPRQGRLRDSRRPRRPRRHRQGGHRSEHRCCPLGRAGDAWSAITSPQDERGYRLRTIAEWSLPRYQVFNRFVNLTLLLDQGMEAPERWKRLDLRVQRSARCSGRRPSEHPAIVLLGAPGSGKSTLLRRLQLDHSIEQLRE
jgi:hypothetical protein